MPSRRELLEHRLDGTAELAVVREEVIDQEVGDVLLRRAHADVGASVARELADQKDQPADAARELALVRAVLRQVDDALVDLAEQNARVHHLRRERLEQLVAGDDGSKPALGEPRDRVVDDPQLRAELAVRAGRIDGAEAVLPEAPPHGQQRIVVDDDVAVLRALADARALKLARDLAAVLLEEVAHGPDRRGLLLQEHLAGDRFDVRSESWTRIVKRSISFWRRRTCGQRALPGADEHDVAVELLGERLGHFSDQRRAVVRVADVLLHLVEDEDRAGHTPVAPDELEHPLEGGEKLLGRDVGRARRKLRLERVPRLGLGRSEVRVARHQRARDGTADIEVVQLGRPLLAGGLDRGLHLVEPALVVEPQAELRLRVLLGEADAAKQDGQDREPDVVGGPAREGAGSREQASGALAGGVELAQQTAQVVGHRRHQAARRRAVRELRVLPQVAQHLQQVRLAAAEEAADPCGLLARLREDSPGTTTRCAGCRRRTGPRRRTSTARRAAPRGPSRLPCRRCAPGPG